MENVQKYINVNVVQKILIYALFCFSGLNLSCAISDYSAYSPSIKKRVPLNYLTLSELESLQKYHAKLDVSLVSNICKCMYIGGIYGCFCDASQESSKPLKLLIVLSGMSMHILFVKALDEDKKYMEALKDMILKKSKF